ncbi:MAG: hypothetical protein WBZ20_04440, partial [Nitrososphaeraceae archaeon]
VVALDMKNKGHEIGSVSIAGEPDVIWNNQNKGRLYCAIGKPGVIDVIDTHTMTLAEEIHTEEGAHTFAFDSTRQLLYAFLPDSCCAAVYIGLYELLHLFIHVKVSCQNIKWIKERRKLKIR